MRLKKGVVYKHNKEYLLVLDCKKVNRRIVYTVQKVSPNGKNTFDLKQITYKKNQFIKTEIVAKLQVEYSKKDNETRIFNRTLKECKSMLIKYASNRNKTYDDTHKMARKIISMLGMSNHDDMVRADLKYIALKLGVKNPTRLYKIVTDYYKGFATDKRREAIYSNASDSTLIKCYDGYRDSWKFIHGFSNKLDELLERDLDFYIKAMRDRNL